VMDRSVRSAPSSEPFSTEVERLRRAIVDGESIAPSGDTSSPRSTRIIVGVDFGAECLSMSYALSTGDALIPIGVVQSSTPTDDC
jgi:hypothetical protein